MRRVIERTQDVGSELEVVAVGSELFYGGKHDAAAVEEDIQLRLFTSAISAGARTNSGRKAHLRTS